MEQTGFSDPVLVCFYPFLFSILYSSPSQAFLFSRHCFSSAKTTVWYTKTKDRFFPTKSKPLFWRRKSKCLRFWDGLVFSVVEHEIFRIFFGSDGFLEKKWKMGEDPKESCNRFYDWNFSGWDFTICSIFMIDRKISQKTRFFSLAPPLKLNISFLLKSYQI